MAEPEYSKALKALLEPTCPACGQSDQTMIERIGRFFLCNVCSKTWPAERPH